MRCLIGNVFEYGSVVDDYILTIPKHSPYNFPGLRDDLFVGNLLFVLFLGFQVCSSLPMITLKQLQAVIRTLQLKNFGHLFVSRHLSYGQLFNVQILVENIL